MRATVAPFHRTPMPKLRTLAACLLVSLAFLPPAFAQWDEVEDPYAPAPVQSVTGVLVSRGGSEVVLKDDGGNDHHFQIDERTRYVWGARSRPTDFAPGARIRAEYDPDAALHATALWILSPPTVP